MDSIMYQNNQSESGSPSTTASSSGCSSSGHSGWTSPSSSGISSAVESFDVAAAIMDSWAKHGSEIQHDTKDMIHQLCMMDTSAIQRYNRHTHTYTQHIMQCVGLRNHQGPCSIHIALCAKQFFTETFLGMGTVSHSIKESNNIWT